MVSSCRPADLQLPLAQIQLYGRHIWRRKAIDWAQLNPQGIMPVKLLWPIAVCAELQRLTPLPELDALAVARYYRNALHDALLECAYAPPLKAVAFLEIVNTDYVWLTTAKHAFDVRRLCGLPATELQQMLQPSSTMAEGFVAYSGSISLAHIWGKLLSC